MANEVVRYVFNAANGNSYINDRGISMDIEAIFKRPQDMTAAQAASLVAAANGTVITEPTVCGLQNVVTPRKLQFIRANGHTMEIVLFNRAPWQQIRDSMLPVLNGLTPNNPVVCIKLKGEHFANLLDGLGVAGITRTPTAPIQPPANTNKTRLMYGGTMSEYLGDMVAFGQYLAGAPVRFSMMTDTPNATPAVINAAASGCIGAVVKAKCPSGLSQYRTPRRYIPTILTTDPERETQTVTVPVANGASADIANCGVELARVVHVICLEYFGESHDRVHLL